MYKFEMHIHTRECDPYSHISGAEVARIYKEHGYQGIVITDHYTTDFINSFKKEINTSEHSEVIKRYLKGYYAAKAEGDKIGITVLCGTEVAVRNTPNHYLIYGLEEKDFYTLPLLCEFPNLEVLTEALPEKACVVQAHPFRNGMSMCDPEKLFGYEVFNNGTHAIRNKLAKILAQEYNKPMTSGSDCHSVQATGRGGIVCRQEIHTQEDLLYVLKSGKYTIIEP